MVCQLHVRYIILANLNRTFLWVKSSSWFENNGAATAMASSGTSTCIKVAAKELPWKTMTWSDCSMRACPLRMWCSSNWHWILILLDWGLGLYKRCHGCRYKFKSIQCELCINIYNMLRWSVQDELWYLANTWAVMIFVGQSNTVSVSPI